MPTFDDIDWCFDDPELTRQLRVVKAGRGKIIAMLVAGLAAFGACVTFLM